MVDVSSLTPPRLTLDDLQALISQKDATIAEMRHNLLLEQHKNAEFSEKIDQLQKSNNELAKDNEELVQAIGELQVILDSQQNDQESDVSLSDEPKAKIKRSRRKVLTPLIELNNWQQKNKRYI